MINRIFMRYNSDSGLARGRDVDIITVWLRMTRWSRSTLGLCDCVTIFSFSYYRLVIVFRSNQCPI
jgi:hypothetical protein